MKFPPLHLILPTLLLLTLASSSSSSPTTTTSNTKIETFLKWFTSNNGTINSHLTLADFGPYGNGLSTTFASTSAINNLETMFTVPHNIIMNRKNIIEHLSTLLINTTVPDKQSQSQSALNKVTSLSDDHIITTNLIIECGKGDASFYKPYMDVLPVDVNVLYKWSESEILEVQDDAIYRGVMKVKRDMKVVYDSVKDAIDSISGGVGVGVGVGVTPNGCNTYANFQHYNSIVASRAMTIRGTKHLSPLADMVNYSPITSSSSGSGTTRSRIADNGNSFLNAHILTNDGSLIVKSDRTTHGSGVQIFEDYGDNSNSVYLEAHGFVPYYNPFNCVVLQAPSLATFDDVDVDVIYEIMRNIGVINKDATIDTAHLQQDENCLTSTSATNTNGGVKSNTRLFAYYAILGLSGDNNKNKGRLDYCKGSSSDRKYLVDACINYTGSIERVASVVSRAAREQLEKSESKSSIDADEGLLVTGVEGRLEMAVRFRLEHKKILRQLSSSSQPVPVPVDRADEDEDNTPPLNLTQAVTSFNTWITSKNFPTNHLTAYVAGSGMRVGTKASTNINQGDVYISVPTHAIMSSSTATTTSDDVNVLIRDSINKKDDFKALLFFLMHERFIAVEKSSWFDYIRLLPSLAEYKVNNPIFFNREKLDFLLGSDVHGLILKMQGNAKSSYASLSSDDSIRSAFGDSWNERSYLWTTTILDSRSIWWGGKRNLVPLLDLINCLELPDPTVIHSTQLDSAGDNAVTKAPGDFKVGEQVYENYGQPNYVYFMYHGFILVENSHDCLPLEFSILQNDRGATDKEGVKRMLSNEGFFSFTGQFCFQESDFGEKLEKMVAFVRMKEGFLSVDEMKNGKLDRNEKALVIKALSVIRSLLKTKLNRFPKTQITMDSPKDYSEECMKSLVEFEKKMCGFGVDFIERKINEANANAIGREKNGDKEL